MLTCRSSKKNVSLRHSLVTKQVGLLSQANLDPVTAKYYNDNLPTLVAAQLCEDPTFNFATSLVPDNLHIAKFSDMSATHSFFALPWMKEIKDVPRDTLTTYGRNQGSGFSGPTHSANGPTISTEQDTSLMVLGPSKNARAA